MALPLLPIITSLVSTFATKKIPAFSQTVGDFAKTKTNYLAIAAFTYGMDRLTTDPDDWVGHLYTLGSLVLVVYRDTMHRYKNNGE